MTWTYSGSPGDSDLDAVRFLIQDTIEASAEMQDEEIDYLLDLAGSTGEAALMAARTLHAKYAKLVDREVGDLRIWYSQRARAWLQTIRSLESTLSTLSPVTVYMGGQDRSEQETDEANESLVQPRFRVGQNDLRFPVNELTDDGQDED